MNLAIVILMLSNLVALCEFPKIVWTYWGKGMESHPTIKMYHDNHRRMIENKGWQVRFLDDSTAEQYIKQSSLYSEKDYKRLQKILAPPAMSDYIRCMLTSHYGGVYVDMSSIMLQDFSWLEFENLRKNTQLVNKYGDSPEVLFFSYHEYGYQQTHFDSSRKQTFTVKTRYQLWFIAAVPNSTFLLEYCPQLTKVYLDEVTKQTGYKRYKQRIIRQENISDSYFMQDPYFVSLDILTVQIVKRQRMLDKISNQTNSSRQLQSWYYNAWHIPAVIGPYSIQYAQGWRDTFVGLFSQQQMKTVLELKSLKYFIKIVNSARDSINSFLLEIPFYDVKRRWKCYFYRDTYCTVYKSSIFYKYLINGSSQYEKKFRISDKYYIKQSAALRLNDNYKFEKIIASLTILTLLIFSLLVYSCIKMKRQSKTINYSNNQNGIKINQNQQLSEASIQKTENSQA